MNSEDCVRPSSWELSERFNLLALDAKEYALFLVGLDGNVLCWNAGAERLFGYATHEVVGRHFSLFFTAEDIVTGKPERELAAAPDDGPFEGDLWQLRKDGTRLGAMSM